MRAVVQRVAGARVSVSGREISSIGEGLFVLLGIERGDQASKVLELAGKVSRLRLFAASDGRISEPLGGREILCVSQFTLLADVSRGNRPGFSRAADREEAEPLYSLFCEACGAKSGAFGEEMSIDLELDGPVTILLDD